MSQQQQPQSLNDSEWMLYRVLQRANLVQYFDMFTAQGGDDVYQLCEAGEEEFLEIMALVGMAGKPLHVRRLQKALHEWLTNPASFKPSEDVRPVVFPPAKGSILSSVPPSVSQASCRFWMNSGHATSQLFLALPENYRGLPEEGIGLGKRETNGADLMSPSGFRRLVDAEMNAISDRNVNVSPSPSITSTGCQSDVPLTEAQVAALEICVAELCKTLPLYASRPLNVKKPIDREIEEVLSYPDNYPNRMDILRKYSAIYGRFDSKRRTDKQMNFHEMCINEAAALLCRHQPSLLTRREDLFSLARQVVRESGFQCSKVHSRTRDSASAELVPPPNKRTKQETFPSQSSPSSRTSSRSHCMRKSSAPLCEVLDQADSSIVQTASLSGNLADDDGVGKSSSLVDEGLRIAQQYGLGEFAEELLGLKRETMDCNETVDGEDVEDEEEEEEGDGGENNFSCGSSQKQASFNSVTGQCHS